MCWFWPGKTCGQATVTTLLNLHAAGVSALDVLSGACSRQSATRSDDGASRLRGVVRAGTVGGQHYEWTAWSEGLPIMTFHCFWIMGFDGLTPKWACGSASTSFPTSAMRRPE